MLSNLHPRFIERLTLSAILERMSARLSMLAAALSLCLSAVAGGIDVHRAAQSADAPAVPPPAPSSDAAEKHAKRTACLNSAKLKKLVGAEKASFLKACMAAP
jgi:hypothetical protein